MAVHHYPFHIGDFRAGCIHMTKLERLVYRDMLDVVYDTGRFCLLPFPMLCRVFTDNWRAWCNEHKTRRQFTPRAGGGYHSECVFVPRRIVWAEIYRQFGGDMKVAA